MVACGSILHIPTRLNGRTDSQRMAPGLRWCSHPSRRDGFRRRCSLELLLSYSIKAGPSSISRTVLLFRLCARHALWLMGTQMPQHCCKATFPVSSFPYDHRPHLQIVPPHNLGTQLESPTHPRPVRPMHLFQIRSRRSRPTVRHHRMQKA
jgi:hypothetical protein